MKKRKHLSGRRSCYILHAHWKALVLAVLLIIGLGLVYVFFSKGVYNKENLIGIIINSGVAALGFIAIFTSIQTDKEIKRFEHIKDFNYHFLTNKEFIDVERKLESCYQRYKQCIQKKNKEEEKKRKWKVRHKQKEDENKWEWKDDYNRDAFKEDCIRIFNSGKYEWKKETDGIITEQYQELINYLVYLEAFVPLIIHHQVRIEEVDDLFGYRFFIAVNNPLVQDEELLEDKEYYQGCIKAYKIWKKYREDMGLVIPLGKCDLEDVL